MAKSKYSKVTIRGNVYYRDQITLPSGKRKTIYGRTIAELKDKKMNCLLEYQSNPQIDAPTVEKYAKKQLELIRQRVMHSTYIGYESKVKKYIIGPLGDKKLSEVTPDDISAALAPVEHQSASSYRTVHMLMRTIFRAARINHLIPEDPTEFVRKSGGKDKKDIPSLSDEQTSILIDAVHGLSVETFILLALYAGLRREEALALKWDCVHLDAKTPYIQIRRAWRILNNRPVISEKLKTKAAKRDIPIPAILYNHLKSVKSNSHSEFVISNNDGDPLSGTQWSHLWRLVKVRSTIPHSYTRYVDGKKHRVVVHPTLGQHAKHNPHVICTINFKVTPHQLRHTYITNLIYSGADPKTVQYLAGHTSSKITMDVYASIKYNRPDDLAGVISTAFPNDNLVK